VIKWRRMIWMGNVAHMGDRRNVYKILVEKPETDHLEDLDINGKIIFV
jgi:hypothetical protein